MASRRTELLIIQAVPSDAVGSETVNTPGSSNPPWRGVGASDDYRPQRLPGFLSITALGTRKSGTRARYGVLGSKREGKWSERWPLFHSQVLAGFLRDPEIDLLRGVAGVVTGRINRRLGPDSLRLKADS